MRWVIAGFLGVLVFLCMTGLTVAAVPDLIGTWTGQSTGYSEGTGFVDYSNGTFSINITEQKDRVLAGFILTEDEKGAPFHKNITGVISADGEDLYLAEQNQGFSIGKILGEDEIELYYLDSKDPLYAGIDHLSRVK